MPRIYVLAGVNGAGKSSVGGAAFRAFGADYFNPDEAARSLMAANPVLPQAEANAQAWQQGKRLLERAVADGLDFAYETTLGANTMPRLLRAAAQKGVEVFVWYAGLSSPELHIARVKARVMKGGHDIPEADIRRRYQHSRLNLIHLLPHLAALRVYDNSAEADPAKGMTPKPVLVLRMEHGKILNVPELRHAPDWAKPIVAAALRLNLH
ncbi:MAG: ZTL protein [Betaproteobacteria bacterium RIFCSPLOWO2_02_FULL_62_17]|nr:MAG: ZTL protein [Betaproteobacteria bacterium RIFCSPLOWO2_02_FULL_62_17]